jgi:hypothetical protein
MSAPYVPFVALPSASLMSARPISGASVTLVGCRDFMPAQPGRTTA